MRTAFVYQINKYLKDKNLYKKGESTISFQDVQDCLVCVLQLFYPPATEPYNEKAITNKFVSQAMTDFLKHYLEVYFLKSRRQAQKICQQVLVNKQSREHAKKRARASKRPVHPDRPGPTGVQKFVGTAAPRMLPAGSHIVGRRSLRGVVKQSRDSDYQAIMPIRGRF